MLGLSPGWTVVVLLVGMLVALIGTSIIASSIERVRIAKHTHRRDQPVHGGRRGRLVPTTWRATTFMFDNHKIADILDGAANEMDKRGMTKHVLTDEDGHVCARGAVFAHLAGRTPDTFMMLDVLFGKTDDVRELEIAASEKMADHMGLVATFHGESRLATWNNAPERTAEEVVSAFRETAASLRLAEIKAEPVLHEVAEYASA